MVISYRVYLLMDCPANHRYHPYAPPADARCKRFIGPGKEWNRQNHDAPFPDGFRGGRQSRYQRGRRGTGNMLRPMNREDLYQPHPSHVPVKSSEGRLYDGPQQKASPSWYQGRSMNYGPPRPPANYYFQRNTRVHYRGGGYSPPPRLHHNMRPARTSPTGLISIFL